MTLKEYQDQMLKMIQEAVDRFNSQIPAIEREAMNRVLDLVKDIEVRRGQIVNTAANLKKIGQLRSQLEKAIINPKLAAELQKFVNAFTAVANLHQKYFSAIDKRPPAEILKELQQQAKAAVIEKLTKEIDVRIIPAVEEILRMNITEGAKYTEMLARMQDYIIGSGEIAGSFGKLSNLAVTITTDSLNTFSAQYSKGIAQSLGMRWRMYVGSNLKTTREWCLYMTKKKYVFEREIPQILKGIIDGHQVHLNKNDMWDGEKEGTNESNIDINRGGWKCGHQFLYVPEAVVPLPIRIETYNRFGIPHENGYMKAA